MCLKRVSLKKKKSDIIKYSLQTTRFRVPEIFGVDKPI